MKRRMETPVTADSLIKAARAWDALRRHAGADEGSDESRRIARDVMSILTRRAGIVRAGECGTTEPAAPREVNKVNQQVSGGGSGI